MNDHYKFENTPLPYAYDALEPYIDEKTMYLHHDKHLQSYVDNLNEALKPYPKLHNMSLTQLILNPRLIPVPVRTKVINNAGGVYNHRFFFDGMTNLKTEPSKKLLGAIDAAFGSFRGFQDEFINAAMSVFGSGYAWLTKNTNGMLKIITTANQNTPLTKNLIPLLTIDVWEHAYYLKHYNKRLDYIVDWSNVINWDVVNSLYVK